MILLMVIEFFFNYFGLSIKNNINNGNCHSFYYFGICIQKIILIMAIEIIFIILG